MTKTLPPTRHIISINDLTNKEIETIFEVAQGFLKELADENVSYRIGRSTDLASKFILASLFYEPSTRTRLSFESAMLRLGGANITSADPAVSSAAKGESLADTIRVISNYADVVVIRHPRDGAARLAAEYSQIPVINGGDGSHEHPTQTLCDLFTLRSKKKTLKNMKVAISGDLKGSRTIHSFVYALARFGATIDPLPAPGMELPAHVDRRLREEFHCRMVSKDPGQSPGGSIDALYVTADQPHQLSLIPDPEIDYGFLVQKKIDAVYVTRFQKERWAEKERPYPKIDAKFLGEAKFSDASVMHPLPRVNELDASFDSDRRAIYFQQAAYGVPIRMALISLLLHLHKNKSLHQFAGGFAKPDHPVYAQPIGTGLQLRQPELHHRRSRRTAICRQQILRHRRGLAAALHAALRLLREGRRRRHRRAIRRGRYRREKLFRPDWRRLPRRPPTSSSIWSSIRRRPTRSRPVLAARRRQEGPRRLGHVALFSRSGFGQYPAAMLHPIEDIAAFLFGYLCGSIPFGVLITRLAGAPDVRTIGSGNIGATNVLRTGRKGLAAATLARRHAQGHCRGRHRRRILRRRRRDRRRAWRLSRPPVSGLARL